MAAEEEESKKARQVARSCNAIAKNEIGIEGLC